MTEDEDKVFGIFCKLPDTLVKELGKLLKIREMPVKRMLFESIIPQLANLMGLKAASEYQDILIGLLEVLAEDNGVNRYKIYSIEEFIGEIEAHSVYKKNASIKRSNLKVGSNLNKKLADALNRKHELRKAAKRIFDAVCNIELRLED